MFLIIGLVSGIIFFGLAIKMALNNDNVSMLIFAIIYLIVIVVFVANSYLTK